jgi:acetyl-CoA synthetase
MLLYTSGTTGKPKGTVQTHAGQLVKCAKDIYFDFDHKPSDRFFWVTDLGWIMGPWTLIGNHAFGGTVFMYEGAPDYPEPDRLWRLIDQHSITTFGTSPTAIRSFMGDEELIEARDLTSLRLLGSTGEPWDPESWEWFYEKVGKSETPIVNVSGGTEMGGHFLSSPPIMPLKPCTVGKPTPGINADIVTDQGESITEPNQRGHLVVRDSCPSMTKSLWSGDDRYLDEYWSRWDGLWDHGDWVNQDADGFWYILGRADDIINIAGRTIGPAEIEAIILDHEAVTEAAAIGVRDEIKGQALVLFVVGETQNNEEQLRNALRNSIAKQFGKPFRPDEIIFTDAIPKNQNDKVLRKKLQSRYNR